MLVLPKCDEGRTSYLPTCMGVVCGLLRSGMHFLRSCSPAYGGVGCCAEVEQCCGALPWAVSRQRQSAVRFSSVALCMLSRDPQDTLPPAETSAGPSANRKPAQRGVAQSRVPHHVQHPEKYTLYTLEEPLVVGGGTGQLGSERQEQLEQVGWG